MTHPDCVRPNEVNVEWLKDAATAAVDDFERLSEARTPIATAFALTELSNRMSDLATFLDDHCPEHGWRAHEEEGEA